MRIRVPPHGAAEEEEGDGRMVSSDSSAMPKGLLLPTSVRLSMLGLHFFPALVFCRNIVLVLLVSLLLVIRVWRWLRASYAGVRH